MTISITIPDAAFTKYVDNILIPYIDDVLAFNLYGVSALESTKNRALSGPDATVAGTPTYAANYAEVQSLANGFDLGQIVDVPYTQVVVARHVSGEGSILGRESGTEAFIGMLRLTGIGPYTLNNWADGSQRTGIGSITFPATEYSVMGARWGGTGTKPNTFYHNGTTLESGTSVDVTQANVPTVPLLVGAGGTGNATFRVAASAFYSRVLLDNEILEVREYLAGLLGSRGIAVL